MIAREGLGSVAIIEAQVSYARTISRSTDGVASAAAREARHRFGNLLELP
jgi:hypothetical protein